MLRLTRTPGWSHSPQVTALAVPPAPPGPAAPCLAHPSSVALITSQMCMNCPHSSVCSAPNVARSERPRGAAVQPAGGPRGPPSRAGPGGQSGQAPSRRAPHGPGGQAGNGARRLPSGGLRGRAGGGAPSLLTDQAAHGGAERVFRSLPESHGRCRQSRAASEGRQQPRPVPSRRIRPLPSRPAGRSLPGTGAEQPPGAVAAPRC